jgi:hypothetical protein
MLKSFMFASQPNSASNRPRRLHPLHSTPCHPGSTPCHPHSNPCHPACPACPERSRGERSRRERSERSAFLSLVAPRHSPLALAPITTFLVYPELRRVYPEPRRATLALDSQLTENPATLSPLPATLTSRVNPNPFVCHSYNPSDLPSLLLFNPLCELCALRSWRLPRPSRGVKFAIQKHHSPTAQAAPASRTLFTLFQKR